MSTPAKCRIESAVPLDVEPGHQRVSARDRLHDEVVDGHLDDATVVDLSPEGEQLVHAGRPTHIEVRSGLLALREPSRDGLADPGVGDVFEARLRTRLRGRHGGGCGGGRRDAVRERRVDVGPPDPSVRPGADHVSEIQAGVPGDLARQWAGEDPLPVGPGFFGRLGKRGWFDFLGRHARLRLGLVGSGNLFGGLCAVALDAEGGQQGVHVGGGLVLGAPDGDGSPDLDLCARVHEQSQEHAVVLGLDVDHGLLGLDGDERVAGGVGLVQLDVPVGQDGLGGVGGNLGHPQDLGHVTPPRSAAAW